MLNMDFKDLKKIVELVSDHDLSEITVEQKGIKLTVKRGGSLPAVYTGPAPSGIPHHAPALSPAPTPKVDDDAGLESIFSPMVGTFYRSPSPETDVFVKVGDVIAPNAVVCIIEAMKVMNEIKAEIRGTIARVLVEDGKPVQYGQPLFELKA